MYRIKSNVQGIYIIMHVMYIQNSLSIATIFVTFTDPKYRYIGCFYQDHQVQDILMNLPSPNRTSANCAKVCYNAGFKFFGMLQLVQQFRQDL